MIQLHDRLDYLPEKVEDFETSENNLLIDLVKGFFILCKIV